MGLPESMVEWRRRKWCLVYLVVVPLYKYFRAASEVARRTCWRPGDESGKGSSRCFLFTISSSSKSSEALPFLKQKAQSSKVAALPFLHKKDIFTRRELRKNINDNLCLGSVWSKSYLSLTNNNNAIGLPLLSRLLFFDDYYFKKLSKYEFN